jgi:Plasmid pRiA4b ORF-3-like protein
MVNGQGRPAPKTAVQLRISLADHLPTIWRRLVVPGEIRLSKLHSIFQAAMGWEGHHLHLFQIGDASYGRLDDELDDDDLDEDSVQLSEVVRAPMRFSYQYDFGDDWQHEVVVESIGPVPLVLKWAVCLDGQRACPPEDCGGTGGFQRFLDAVGHAEHADHDELVEWFGRPFDPEGFTVAGANAALQRVK